MAAVTIIMSRERRWVVISHGDNRGESDHLQTFLVTGGYGGIASTELLEESAATWVLAGELPTPRWGLSVATIDNRVLATGQ